jgi:hypothetical protein
MAFFPDRGSFDGGWQGGLLNAVFFPDRGSFDGGWQGGLLNAGIRRRMVDGRVAFVPSQGPANTKLGLRTHLGPARRSALPGPRRI